MASVNEYASQIAKLNAQISLTENTGGDAADLKDQRDKLVTKLSGSINVHVFTDGTGKLVISAGALDAGRGRSRGQLVGQHARPMAPFRSTCSAPARRASISRAK